jgi:tetratricopeptide (TPR) repeat protein
MSVSNGNLMRGLFRNFLLVALSMAASGPVFCELTPDDDGTSPPTTLEQLTRCIQSGRVGGSDLAAAYRARGEVHLQSSQFALAILDFEQAIRLEPTASRGYIDRAEAYYDSKDYPHAIQDYEQAIRLKPDFAAAFDGRGVAYQRNGEYAKSIDDFNRVNQLDPNDAIAYFQRGLSYLDSNDFERAIRDFDQAPVATQTPPLMATQIPPP